MMQTRRSAALLRASCHLAVFVVGLSLCTAALTAQESTARNGDVTSAAVSLQAGDMIRVRIWREPDLTGEFLVDERGVVNLPRLGPIAVVGEPVDRLKARIVEAYGEYVTEPAEVTTLWRVHVGGEVRTPGLYHVDATITAADAIALAGGTTGAARKDRVRLVRNGVETRAKLSPGDPVAVAPLRSGDQLIVPGRSWMYRAPGLAIGAVTAVGTLLWALRRY